MAPACVSRGCRHGAPRPGCLLPATPSLLVLGATSPGPRASGLAPSGGGDGASVRALQSWRRLACRHLPLIVASVRTPALSPPVLPHVSLLL